LASLGGAGMPRKKITTREWLKANMKKYKDYEKCKNACMKATKKTSSTVRKCLNEMWKGERGDSRCADGKAKKHTVVDSEISMEDIIDKKSFLGSVDIVAQILEYLDEVVKDSYVDNEKLRRKFNLGSEKWRDISRLPVMEGRTLSYNDRDGRKTTVWSSKKGIAAAKETISMARYDK
jgi:hypothetical protein